ncbi:MAG: hypothetical protein BGN96_15805 [Bacteroidales bacterium 45-6]|nr:MAG: hypothetical protein BGN96_15805 [Bacteroidales bacterium 45-6]
MSNRIKDAIKKAGYTQEEFAGKMGISRVGLSQLLRSPSYPTLEKIAAALDVPMWQLFIEEVQPNQNVITCPKCGTKLEVKEKE